MNEHWLDRLAERQTRGRFVASLVAGAAVTLPLARALPAFGAATRTYACSDIDTTAINNNPLAFQQGCKFWASNTLYPALSAKCESIGSSIALSDVWLILGPVAQIGGNAVAIAAAQVCQDRAVLQRDAQLYHCTEAYSPGFTPCMPGGPCDNCTGICCVDPNVVSGFSCCTPAPGGCCKADGCHSGVTACGG